MNDILARLLLLNSDDAHEDALRIMLARGIEAADAEEGSLLVLDEATQELVFVMTAGDMLTESALKGQRVPLGQGLSGIAAQTGELQIGTPIHTGVHQPLHRDQQAPRQLMAAPMRYRERVVGVLTAATYKPERHFSTEQIQMFGSVATLAGIVVATRQSSQFSGDDDSGVPAAHESPDELARLVSETALRIGRSDGARLRSLLNLLRQVERLGS